MEKPTLFMCLIGCTPKGRHTEQHDVFFSIGNSLADLKPDMQAFWPDSGPMHLDAWRRVTETDGFQINVVPLSEKNNSTDHSNKLFFINLGGYKHGEFEEYHYKMLVVAKDKSSAIKAAKATAFYKHTGFSGAESHIDDKYGIDVDDMFNIEDILPAHQKEKYFLQIEESNDTAKDECFLGYFMFNKIK